MFTTSRVIFIFCVLLAFDQRDAIQGVIQSFIQPNHATAQSTKAELPQAKAGPVIFFTKSWCGWCDKTRSLLKAKNVEYVEYDIERSAKGKAWHKQVGGKGVPVLIFGDKVKHGYNKKKILRLIAQHQT